MTQTGDLARRLAVARGDEPADLVVHGGRVLSVFTREWLDVDVAICDGVVAALGSYEGVETLAADGAYVVRIAANATGGREATVDVPLTVVRTIGRVMLDSPAMTPNGDGRGDVLSVSIPLAAPAELTVRILRDGRWVATPFAGEEEAERGDGRAG